MYSEPMWSVQGKVTSKRALKSRQSGEVFADALEIAGAGRTIECTARDLAVCGDVREGQFVKAEGTFSEYEGRTKFDLVSITAVKAG